jgi:TolA-binding protein
MTNEDWHEELIKVVERSKSNTKRLDEVEAQMKENSNLIVAIKELAVETKYMREDLNQTIQRLDKLETDKQEENAKKEDKWEKFKWMVLAATITVLVAFLAASMGLKE